jgi:hypothetical protein
MLRFAGSLIGGVLTVMMVGFLASAYLNREERALIGGLKPTFNLPAYAGDIQLASSRSATRFPVALTYEVPEPELVTTFCGVESQPYDPTSQIPLIGSSLVQEVRAELAKEVGKH